MTDQNDIETVETDETPAEKGKGKDQTGEKTFTQKDLDYHAGKRAKEAKQAAINDLLKELGFEKPEALKELVTTARKKQENELTETQKLQKELEELKGKATAAEQRAQEAENKRLADRVDGEIKALAAKFKADYPEDVVKYLRENHKDEVSRMLSEDGKVDSKAVETALALAKKARPSWFGVSGPGSPSNREGRPAQPGTDVVLKKKIQF